MLGIRSRARSVPRKARPEVLHGSVLAMGRGHCWQALGLGVGGIAGPTEGVDLKYLVKIEETGFAGELKEEL